MIDEWVGGLGAPLAQRELRRPLNEEVLGPLPPVSVGTSPQTPFIFYTNTPNNVS